MATPHVLIIGGGFAGVWSAAGAALARERLGGDGRLRITLVAPGEHLVLRPRLYEPEPDLAVVRLGRILDPIGVRHVRARVTAIDTERRVVVAGGERIGYDRLVLAAGSALVRPRGLPGAERLHDIDTLEGARRLAARRRDRADYSAVVVGAGFVGLEAATALAARGRVLLVDRSPVAGEPLGPGPRAVIEHALDTLGVERRLGTTLTAVGDGRAVLSDGTEVEADAVVWCAGMRAAALARQISGELDDLGRVPVDRRLRALPEVFAAGDVAAAAFDAGHTVMQACQHATPLGKVAGHNAAADLLGAPLRDFTPGPYVTCLDLGGAGAVFTRGWDRRVMASGAAGKEIKARINRQIHPPVDDAGQILAAADRVYLELPFFPGAVEQPGDLSGADGAGVPAARGAHRPDDEDVDRDDRQRPQRVVRQPHEVGDHGEAGHRDGHHPRPHGTVEQTDAREDEQDAQRQMQPAPRGEVGLVRVVARHDEDVVLGDSRDALEDAQRATEDHHDRGEGEPAGLPSAASRAPAASAAGADTCGGATPNSSRRHVPHLLCPAPRNRK